jgi:hypothetical protein
MESPFTSNHFLYLYPMSEHIYVWVTIKKNTSVSNGVENIDNSGTTDPPKPAKSTPKLRTSSTTTRQPSVTIHRIFSSLPFRLTSIYIGMGAIIGPTDYAFT